MTIECTLFWGFENGLKGNDWAGISYTKNVTLPFMPNKKIELEIDGCCPIRIKSVEYSIDENRCRVYLEDWDLDPHETWQSNHDMMTENGWKLLDTGGVQLKPADTK